MQLTSEQSLRLPTCLLKYLAAKVQWPDDAKSWVKLLTLYLSGKTDMQTPMMQKSNGCRLDTYQHGQRRIIYQEQTIGYIDGFSVYRIAEAGHRERVFVGRNRTEAEAYALNILCNQSIPEQT